MLKLAFITGATSGIGLAFAELLAQKGIGLILTGRDQDKLKELSEKYHSKIFTANLAQPEGVLLAIAHIHQHKPDLVVNCAGFGFYGEITTMPSHDVESMIQVNNTALVELTIAAADTYIKNSMKGIILNISSVAPFYPCPMYAVYGATKAFVNAFSEAADFELSPKGVRVLTACPGRVGTHFSERAAKGKNVVKSDDFLKMSSEEVAQELWQQVEKGQRIRLINWKYRMLSWVTSLIPRAWQAESIIKKMKAQIK